MGTAAAHGLMAETCGHDMAGDILCLQYLSEFDMIKYMNILTTLSLPQPKE